MNKKHFLFSALISIALLTIIFTPLSVSYDPWVDYDEDGDIDPDDFSVFAGEYGTSGDSTKNVSVTNWPEPQKPNFAEVLTLRGLAYRLRKTDQEYVLIEDEVPQILVEANMPHPPVDIITNRTYLCEDSTVTIGWERQPDENFTYVPASAPFFIQGDVPVRTTLQYYVTFSFMTSEVIYCNITVHLEKTTLDETTIVVASDTISLLRGSDTSPFTGVMRNLGVVLRLPSPVLVELGERLQIRFETWTRCEDGYTAQVLIELFHELGTDEFIAYIPIYQP